MILTFIYLRAKKKVTHVATKRSNYSPPKISTEAGDSECLITATKSAPPNEPVGSSPTSPIGGQGSPGIDTSSQRQGELFGTKFTSIK